MYVCMYVCMYVYYIAQKCAIRPCHLLRQGSVTGVILVGRPDSLGFHSVTWLVGFWRIRYSILFKVRVVFQNEKEGGWELSIDLC